MTQRKIESLIADCARLVIGSSGYEQVSSLVFGPTESKNVVKV